MICKNCGKEFEGQFCPECGTKANELQKCPVCGKERVEGEKFCANCGYNYTQEKAVITPQAKTKTQNESVAKIFKAFTKAYWIIPAVGTLLLGVLLLLTLCAPVMLHEGYDISGIGFKHIFKVNIDYVFTSTCALILVMSIFVIILGIARIINALAKPYANIKDKKSYIIDGVICLAVLALGIAGAANAGNWFGSAGAGYSFCIFIGILGIALVALRYVFENKFIDSDIAKESGQKIKDKGYIKNNADVKINKGIKKGSIVLASLIVIALVIGIIVSSIYSNPFNATSFKTVQTRGDIISLFGLPEDAKEDSSSYTYVGGEISGYNYLSNNLETLEEEQLEEGLESESDEDLEDAFGGLMKLDNIIEKLNEKADSASSKKTTVYFNSDGGEDRNADTISSYICEVSSLKNTEDGVTKRYLEDLQIIDAYVTQYTAQARVEYIAKYDDESFIKNTVEIQLDEKITSEKQLPVEVTFSDKLGEYNISLDNLIKIEGKYFIENNTLYLLNNIAEGYSISMPDNISKDDISKIVVYDSVSEIYATTFEGFTNVQEIVLPDAEIIIEKGAFADTAYYNNSANWHNGEVLYIGNHLLEAKTSLSGSYSIKENTIDISQQAFADCVNLTSIVIPDSVTSIADNTFYGCTGLTSIVIPDSVTSIGDWAFDGCSNITKATIPTIAIDDIPQNNLQEVIINGGESIGNYAFEYCTGLTSVTIGNSVTSIEDYAFSGCTSLTSIVIPDSITSIADNTFYGCTGLTSVTIPDSVTSIGSSAFYNCTSLTSVTIGDSVTSIGGSAFEDCTGLTSVTIPDSVTSIGSSAFSGCSITKATIPTIAIDDIPQNNLQEVIINGGESIGYKAFYNCIGLTSVTIGNSVTSIGSYAFSGCTGLTNIVIPDSVTSIGESAFEDCTGLTSIVIPDSVNSIGWSAFEYCTGLTSVTIGNSVTRIVNSAFYNCTGLTDVYYTGDIAGWCNISFGNYSNPMCYAENLYIDGELLQGELIIPDSVTSIRYAAFEDCTGLTSVTIPDSVTSIGSSAFYNCTSLTSVTIGDSVTSIGGSAFSGCTGLTDVYYTGDIAGWCNISFGNYSNPMRHAENLYINGELLKGELIIPDSVTSIRYAAFEDCTGLTSIVIPDSVTSIGEDAFYNCTDLTSVTIGNSVTSIGGAAFYKCTGLTSIVIPDSVTSIGESAFEDCTGLTSIVIPDSVNSIGWSAFEYCTGLTSVTIGNSVTRIVNSAFYNCTGLTDVYYTGDIASWCNISFYQSTSNPMYYAKNLYIDGELLQGELIIPDSVTSIGDYAFYGCTSLTSIVIPDSVTSIGEYAFEDCTGLTDVYYTGDIAGWCNISFGNYSNPMRHAENLYINGELLKGELIIPDSVTSIRYAAFEYCTGLTSIVIPDSVTSIGNYVFYKCTGLTNIVIPDSVTSIGWCAFRDCSNVTIYCEATSKPSGWDSDWNYSNRPVVWGYTG